MLLIIAGFLLAVLALHGNGPRLDAVATVADVFVAVAFVLLVLGIDVMFYRAR